MTSTQILPFFGFLLSTCATLIYLRDMFQSDTYPNRATSLLWSLPPFIAAAAAFSKGAGWSVLPVLAEGLSPLSIFLASFYKPRHIWHLGSVEWVCAALTLCALVLWQMTDDANFAAALAVLIDALASLPTLRKGWLAPYSESALTYGLSGCAYVTCFFSLQTPSFAAYAFPVYGLLFCLGVTTLLLARRLTVLPPSSSSSSP